MIRWGIFIILLGACIALFLSRSAGNQLVDIGKWVALLGVVLALIYAIVGAGPRGGGGRVTPF